MRGQLLAQILMALASRKAAKERGQSRLMIPQMVMIKKQEAPQQHRLHFQMVSLLLDPATHTHSNFFGLLAGHQLCYV